MNASPSDVNASSSDVNASHVNVSPPTSLAQELNGYFYGNFPNPHSSQVGGK